MNPRIPSTPNTEEPVPAYHRRAVYAPFVWVAMWVIRLGLRAGFVSPDLFKPAAPSAKPIALHNNRQARRGKAACMRRALRFVRKHGGPGIKLDPERYMPRAFRAHSYIAMMPKHWSLGRFRENYIRDNDISRAEFYGLDGAHHIAGFVPGILECALGFRDAAKRVLGLSPLNSAASDPAPP